jgi:hypothetical protein
MDAPKTVEWREVVSGDQLKSVKNGKLYPVLGTTKVQGGYAIQVQLETGPRTITRPSEKEPRAVVIRGETGKAVDVIVEVFSS